VASPNLVADLTARGRDLEREAADLDAKRAHGTALRSPSERLTPLRRRLPDPLPARRLPLSAD
jgi:hypothetical protein